VRLPAEWEPQSAVMLTWPHGENGWGPDLDAVEQVFTRLVSLIAGSQRLLVICTDGRHGRYVRGRLHTAGVDPGRICLATAPSDDCWARDHGPVTVVTADTPILLDLRFNGWGGRFAHARDDRINRRLAAQDLFGRAQWRFVDLVLEGGAIETDGAGTLLTTRSALLSPRRNPGMTQKQLEHRLSRLMGIRRFLWLGTGRLSGDDTDGHVDTLARFCSRDTIAYVRCPDPGDPDYPGLRAMERELQAFSTARGLPYRLVPLPAPRPVHAADGRRLPASYANFLIINHHVLVPAYGDPADAAAVDVIQACFPGRQATPLDCLPIIRQNGGLHCLTMQLPKQIELTCPPA
jgi:agmatine/peptidylarginine deiminase